MEVKLIVSKFMGNNTMYIRNDGFGIIVDPSFNKNSIIEAIADDKVIAVVITHGHYDHFATADYFSSFYDVPIYAHKNEIKNMQNPNIHLGPSYGVQNLKSTNIVEIEDRERIDFGHNIVLDAIRVEGHTSDSLCFYNEENKFLITGDTVFKGTVGRVDLHKNDMNEFLYNIKNRLFILPEDTLIYPGHGPLTSIAEEKRRPFYNENFY